MDTRTIVEIVLPFPSSKLHAHNSGHWRTKSAAVKDYRKTAMAAALKELPPTLFEHAEITYRFFVPDNRRRDAANLIQMVKPGVDGLVDARLIQDDCWQRLKIAGVYIEIDRDNPRVELSLADNTQIVSENT